MTFLLKASPAAWGRGAPKRVARRFVQSGRLAAQGLRDPLFVMPGHYYSPLPSADDVERALARPAATEAAGVDLRAEQQVALAETLDLAVPADGRWIENNMYGEADASVLRAMLLHLRPSRVVEVGSGYSTALMLDLAESTLPDLRITCVEPYADRLRSRLRPGDGDRLTLLERPAQDVPLGDLVDAVGPGDVLFIDSTHVVKLGSDVCYLFFEVLPRLPVGAVVHVHDIFWPFEYPEGWLRAGRAWTELYLLRAFLMNNSDWEVLFFSSWFWKEHPDRVPPATRGHEPGSIWLRRRA